MRRLQKVIVAITLAVITILGAGLYWLTGEQGTRQLSHLAQSLLPELTLNYERGSLRSGLHLQSVEWRQSEILIQARDVFLKVNPKAILTKIVIHEIKISKLTIELFSESSEQNTALPEIRLPFALGIRLLDITLLEINTNGTGVDFHQISGSLEWAGHQLSSPSLVTTLFNIKTSLAGSIQFLKQYPIEVNFTLTSSTQEVAGSGIASGSLDDLRIDFHLQPPYAAQLQARVHPLDTGTPYSFTASMNTPYDFGRHGIPLALNNVTLTAQGNTSSIEGDLRLKIYQPAVGDISLSAILNSDYETFSLAPLLASSDHFVLQSNCQMTPLEKRAQCRGAIESLDLAFVSPNLSSKLASEFEVLWDDETESRLSLHNLNGTWEGRDVSGKAEIFTRNFQTWTLPSITLNVSGQSLTASGSLGTASDLALTLDIPEVQKILPAATGRIFGSASITGELQQPTLRAKLRGESLAFGALHIEGTELRGHLIDWQSGALSIGMQMNNLQLADTTNDVFFTATGNSDKYAIDATVTGDVPASLRCAIIPGKPNQWNATCDPVAGELPSRYGPIPWRTTNPPEWVIDPEQLALQIKPFCIRAEAARLCLDQTAVLTQGSMESAALTLRGLPLRWALPPLPNSLQIANEPTIAGELTLSGTTLLGRLQLSPSEWLVGLKDRTQSVTINDASLKIKSTQRGVTADVLATSDIGNADFSLRISTESGRDDLSGSVTLSQLQLDAFTWAHPDIEHMEGTLDANLSIKGNRANPSVDGDVRVAASHLSLAPLPMALEAIHAQVQLQGYHGIFRSQFEAGDGAGRFDGGFVLPSEAEDWSLEATLQAQTISLDPLPDSTISGDVSLALAMNPKGGNVKGKVLISKADIQLRELPSSAYGVSSDAVVLGSQQQDPWPFNSEIQVDLGRQFHFEGFGADVNLEGALLYVNDAQRSHYGFGEVTISEGRYRAYGQRLVVRRGSFLFNGPLADPDIVIEAVRDRLPPDVIAGLRVSGSLRNPHAELFSEPTMPETEIAHYVLTGKPASRTVGGNFDASATLLSLGLAGSNKPAAELAEKFGLRDLELSADSGENGVETEVSAYLTPKLQVRYGHAMADNSNTITLQYQLGRNFVVEAISGAADALDFLYTFEINRRRNDNNDPSSDGE